MLVHSQSVLSRQADAAIKYLSDTLCDTFHVPRGGGAPPSLHNIDGGVDEARSGGVSAYMVQWCISFPSNFSDS